MSSDRSAEALRYSCQSARRCPKRGTTVGYLFRARLEAASISYFREGSFDVIPSNVLDQLHKFLEATLKMLREHSRGRAHCITMLWFRLFAFLGFALEALRPLLVLLSVFFI